MRRTLLFLNRFILLLLSIALTTGCLKTAPFLNNNPGNSLGDTTAAVTDVGFPAGLPITQTIGPGGGSIISSDSAISLTIPAGALSANTDITIQPVTNECPGGMGLAYDLLPNGTKFAKPVTLTFHYTDDQMNGSDPLFCTIAYQDSAQEWKADLLNRDFDSLAKTISLDILHFTQYAQLKIVSIGSINELFRDGQQGALEVAGPPKDISQSQKSANPGDDDYLPALPIPHPVSGSLVTKWGVKSSDGTINPGSGNPVTYQAPSSIKTLRKITVFAVVSIPPIMERLGKKGVWGGVPQQYTFYKTLELVPANLSFNVKLEFKKQQSSTIFNDNYYDMSSIQADVKNTTVTVTVTASSNQAPTVSSATGTDGFTTATWIPDGIGELNVISATGNLFNDPDPHVNRLWVHLDLTEQGEVTPKWTLTNPGNTTIIGGDLLPPNIWSPIEFPISPDQLISGFGNSAGSFKITITLIP